MAMALPTKVMAMLLSTMLQLNMSRAAIGRKDMVIKEYLLRPPARRPRRTILRLCTGPGRGLSNGLLRRTSATESLKQIISRLRLLRSTGFPPVIKY